jgi:hypothetical protein
MRATTHNTGGWVFGKQVGNPTSTTSHLKRRETKDAQVSAHFFMNHPPKCIQSSTVGPIAEKSPKPE